MDLRTRKSGGYITCKFGTLLACIMEHHHLVCDRQLWSRLITDTNIIRVGFELIVNTDFENQFLNVLIVLDRHKCCYR